MAITIDFGFFSHQYNGGCYTSAFGLLYQLYCTWMSLWWISNAFLSIVNKIRIYSLAPAFRSWNWAFVPMHIKIIVSSEIMELEHGNYMFTSQTSLNNETCALTWLPSWSISHNLECITPTLSAGWLALVYVLLDKGVEIRRLLCHQFAGLIGKHSCAFYLTLCEWMITSSKLLTRSKIWLDPIHLGD